MDASSAAACLSVERKDSLSAKLFEGKGKRKLETGLTYPS
jgi:hypothetical protein